MEGVPALLAVLRGDPTWVGAWPMQTRRPSKCRPFEQARQAFGRLQQQWNAGAPWKPEGGAGTLRARVSELAEARDAEAIPLVGRVAKLSRAQDKQAQWHRSAGELVTRAANDDRLEWCQHAARHDSKGQEAQGAMNVARKSDGCC